MTGQKAPAERTRWKQDPDAVRADILRIATSEFARAGLEGARMDEIAARTKTSKRMIYYYFGDKAGLYRAVLEQAYRDMRLGEEELALDDLPADAALRRLVEYSFDHHMRNTDFIRLVMNENMHGGAYLQLSDEIRRLNASAIARVEAIYARGCAEGAFRAGLSPMHLHWLISGLSFFNSSNRATFALIFGEELFTPTGQETLRGEIVEMVMRYVAARG